MDIQSEKGPHVHLKSPSLAAQKGIRDSGRRRLNGCRSPKANRKGRRRWRSFEAGDATFQYQEAKMTLKRRGLMHNSSAMKDARYLPHPLWNYGEEIKVMRQPTRKHPGGVGGGIYIIIKLIFTGRSCVFWREQNDGAHHRKLKGPTVPITKYSLCLRLYSPFPTTTHVSFLSVGARERPSFSPFVCTHFLKSTS